MTYIVFVVSFQFVGGPLETYSLSYVFGKKGRGGLAS